MTEKKIRKTNRILFYVGIMLIISILTIPTTMASTPWYKLVGYPNYCPRGLPDFDQHQIEELPLDYCGPSSVSDILWWFDSKHENAAGFPGDGSNLYPLVSPYTGEADDHNATNVPKLMRDFGKNFCQITSLGVLPTKLKSALSQYIASKGLSSYYTLSNWMLKPTPSNLVTQMQNQNPVILFLRAEDALTGKLAYTHYVAVAAARASPSQIKLSDPLQDAVNYTNSYTLHNDPYYVSHDQWDLQKIISGITYIGYYQIINYDPGNRVIITQYMYIHEN